jgi:hypothetical protein
MNIWQPKGQTTTSTTKKDDDDDYNPNAMEEYLKKQKQMQAASGIVQKKPVPADKDYSESSDKYDEDFESLSRSQNALTSS